MPSMPRSEGSSVSQISTGVPRRANLGVPAEDDDPVGARDQVVGELFRCLVGDVDADLEQRLRRTAR